jgi:hypothetical protein
MLENIKSEILKSGFPLEIFVFNACSKKNMGRIPNLHYTTNDGTKEIDLLAFFSHYRLQATQHLQFTTSDLMIACKKSETKPWVFFSIDDYKGINHSPFLKYSSDFDLYYAKIGATPLMSHIYKWLPHHHYASGSIPVCVSYVEAFAGEGKASQDIYKAVESVRSFLHHNLTWNSNLRKNFGVLTAFFYPIIVMDGHLVEASIRNGSIKLRERNHVMLRLMDRVRRDDVTMIDVVRKEYFESFLNIINKDHKETVDAINRIRFPKSFVRRAAKQMKK